ncbi:7-cyano-7-deazaguanine synthase QueC [Aeromicrobium sp. A1-2]|nr:7-cyano-7-deazaguanine synthase QueC [Aeromicrobium sp. A1-2]
MKPKAIVLLSGGLDSSTVLAHALNEGYDVKALSFRYGQRHAIELKAAERVAKAFEVTEHVVCDIDLGVFGGSALTADIEVPKHESAEELNSDIPVTYVPARNTVFLSFALAFAEVSGANDIFIGVSALDYSGYPDCRPEFIEAFERMANLATKAGVEGSGIRIKTPLINLTKAQTVEMGLRLGVDYSLTSTCYDPAADGTPCGQCDSCHLRIKGFEELGLKAPLVYR